MSKLEIRYFTGDVEEHALSKRQPVSIGRHASNDVCIDEDDVGTMHCRIAWNKNGYEVIAAQSEGVEVNGTLVKHALLQDDDLLRIGTVDVLVKLDAAEMAAAAPAQRKSPADVPASEQQPQGRRGQPLPDDLFEDDEPAGSQAGGAGARAGTVASRESRVSPASGYEDSAADELDEAERENTAEEGSSEFSDDETEGDDVTFSIAERLRRRLDWQSVRPGEQDVLRSKFVISLVVGMLVLALTAGVLWFWANRNAAEVLKEQADQLKDDGKYNQAIDLYSQFLNTYPQNDLTNEVFFARARARVEQNIKGSVPNWKDGLKAVQEFIRKNREREGYADQTETIRGYAQDIALGACRSAQASKDRSLLPVAIEARNLARQFQTVDEFEASFKSAYVKAKREVERKEAFDANVQSIREALAEKDVGSAIQHRLDFLQLETVQGHPRPEERRVLDDLLKQTMETERSLLSDEEIDRPAQQQDRPERARHALTMAAYIPPKESPSPDGAEIVLVLAKQACYGVNSATGQPVWRRAIGRDTPFFPLPCQVDGPCVLLFDTDFHELQVLDRRDGTLLWRQPLRDADGIPESLAGAPLIHAGQIFVPTLKRNLYQVDLASGRILKRLTFSQKLLGPPVMAPGNDRLIVAGNRALLYTVTLHPKLQAERVDYVGHRAGSLQAPLTRIGRNPAMMRIGKLLLLCENLGTGKSAQCRLRVLNTATDKPDEWLEELTFDDPDKQVRVDGHVLDPPVLWSNKLYVVSGGQWITVFTVSDDTQQPEAERTKDQFLRRITRRQLKTVAQGPLYLVAGPNRQLWLAGNGIRKFHFKTNSIQLDTREIRFGQVTQPPQVIGSSLYVARRSNFSEAVHISETNRNEMIGTWRLVLGTGLRAWSPAGDGLVIALNEEGHLFRIQPSELTDGGFHLETSGTLPLPNELAEPLLAAVLPDGQIVAAAGGEKPRLWIINSLGQIRRTISLPDPLQSEPVMLGEGLLLPLPGRLRYIALTAGGPSRVEDFQLPFEQGEQPPRWLQVGALSKTAAVGLDSRGRLMRVALGNNGGRWHLSQTAARNVQPAPLRGFAVHQGDIVIADADGTVQRLNPNTLQPAASIKPGGSITNAVWTVDDRVFVEIDRQRLLCYELEGDFQLLWDLPLQSKAGLADIPTSMDGMLVVTERHGTLHWVEPETGNARASVSLSEPVAQMPRPVGGRLIVPTIDGSMYSVSVPAQPGG